jgi:hypothetical protein
MLLLRLPQINQLGKNQAHIPSLIHDGRVTIRAVHFRRHLIFLTLFVRGVKHERVGALFESNIGFAEYGAPLERCGLTPRNISIIELSLYGKGVYRAEPDKLDNGNILPPTDAPA